MKRTIEIHKFQNGNQGFHYLYGTLERDVRYTTLRAHGNGCATGPIQEWKVPFVFLGRSRFILVKPAEFELHKYGALNPIRIMLSSDFEIPKRVDKLITKAKEKVLQ